MFCELCSNSPTVSNNSNNDCVIEFLDKIKIHYNKLKKNYDSCKAISEKLKIENADLHRRIAESEEKLLADSPCKRRKTHSPSKSDTEVDENKSITPSKESSEEFLSDLNAAMDITDVNWSESFVLSLKNDKNITPTTPKKSLNVENNAKIRQVLSPLNKTVSPPEEERPIPSSPLRHTNLPRRLKLSASKKENRSANKNVEKSSKWITPKDPNSLIKTLNNDLGMSFIQPHKSSNLTKTNFSPSCSKAVGKSNTPSPRNNLSLKTNSKLRQTKLVFDIVKDDKEKQIIDADETFCDDFIEPSPTSVTNYLEEGSNKTTRKKNLSNFSRKKSENLFTFALKKSTNSSLIPDNVKKEKTDKTIKLIDANQNPNVIDDSVILISDQPDDIIIIDNTDIDYNKFNTKDLIDEMALKTEEIPTFCGAIENNDMTVRKALERKPSPNVEHESGKKELDELLKSACSKCREYFKCVGRHLPTEELKSRLRNCNHKAIGLSSTPEGFWDPIFRQFSDDDPRNETLIHDEFINA